MDKERKGKKEKTTSVCILIMKQRNTYLDYNCVFYSILVLPTIRLNQFLKLQKEINSNKDTIINHEYYMMNYTKCLRKCGTSHVSLIFIFLYLF